MRKTVLRCATALASVVAAISHAGCGNDFRTDASPDASWPSPTAYPALENVVAGVRIQENAGHDTWAVAVLGDTPQTWPAGPKLDTCSTHASLWQSLGWFRGLRSAVSTQNSVQLLDDSDHTKAHTLTWIQDDTHPRYQGSWPVEAGLVDARTYALKHASGIWPLAAALPEKSLEVLTPTHVTQSLEKPLKLQWRPGSRDVVEIVATVDSGVDGAADPSAYVACVVHDDGEFEIDLRKHGFPVDGVTRVVLRRYRMDVRDTAEGKVVAVGILEADHPVVINAPVPLSAGMSQMPYTAKPSFDGLFEVSSAVGGQCHVLQLAVNGGVAGSLTQQIHRIEKTATTLASAIDHLEVALGGTGEDVVGNVAKAVSTVGGESGSLLSRLGEYSEGRSILSDIGGGASSVQSALQSVASKLSGNANFSSSLYNVATNIATSLDDGLGSLPAGVCYATVTQAASSDGHGGINMVLSSGLGAGNETYNIPFAAIGFGVSSGGSFVLSNAQDSIVLFNRSGAVLRNQTQVLHYLNEMYPVGSLLGFGISDCVSSIRTMLGGTASSARARIAALSAMLLQSPTGVLRTDLNTVRALIVDIPAAHLEDDIATINNLLDLQNDGASIQTRIGIPLSNGTSTDLMGVIGGTGSSVADRLGDPVLATHGLAALIGAANASNGNGIWNDFSGFTNATTLSDQLAAFFALLQASATTNGDATTLTFDISGSPPANLGEFLGRAVSVQ